MAMTLTENSAIDVGEFVYSDMTCIKELPSIASVVSISDPEKERVPVKSKVEETTDSFCASEVRDDVSTLCFVDNICDNPNPFALNESREEDRDSTSVSKSITENPPSAVSANILVKNPENDSKGDENSASWYTMFTSPTKLFTSDIVAQSDKNNDDDDDDDDDGESIGSSSVFSRMFDDLESLASKTTFGFHGLLNGTNGRDNVGTAPLLDDISFMSGKEKDVEMDDEVMEKAIEMKLSEMNLGKTVVRSASTPVRSANAFLRSYSAPALRTRKVGASPQSRSKVLAQELRAARETHGRYDIECAKIMSPLANALYEEGDYGHALAVHKEALSIYSTKLGDNHFATIDSNICVGETLEALDRYDDAIQMYYNVREMRKVLKGDTDSSVADTEILISRALRKKTGRQAQALKGLKRALKVYRHSLGDKHPKVMAAVDDIASVYMEDGNFSKAALILDELVKLKAATYGMYSADVSSSLRQLGISQYSSGATANAIKSMTKAYTINVSVNGENGDQTILTLEHIADFLRKDKNHKQAIAAYMAVLKGKKMRMSDNDPSLADTYADLGLCLRDNGDLDKATKCLKQSLTIYLQISNDVLKVAQVMHDLGIAHQLRGSTKEAVKVFKQELAIRRKLGPSELPQVARSLFYLGTAKYDQNDYQSSLSFLTEALSVYEKLDDDLGLDFAETLFSSGLVFKAMKQVDRARHAFLESLKLFHAHGLGNDNELVKMATAKLKEMGHKCECKSGNCNQVPCRTNYGTIKC